MVDPAQIVLFLVIIVLTTLLVALGIQVFFILRELRKAVGKANKILESVSTPLATLSTLMMGIKTGVSVASLLKRVSKFGESKMEDKKDGEVRPDKSLPEDEKKPLIRRFFRGISRKSL